MSAKKGSPEEAAPSKSEVNQILGDRRMRLVNVPVNKEVVSLQGGDMNGDGKLDLVLYGNPAELVILFNEGKGRFGNARRINSGEAIESGGALTVADLNRDGTDDIALLGANELILVYQGEKGKLSEPERLPHTASNPRMVKAVDIDGDGGNDLVILEGGSEDPLRIRFSAEGGKLGPEQLMATTDIAARLSHVRPDRWEGWLRDLDHRESVGQGEGAHAVRFRR